LEKATDVCRGAEAAAAQLRKIGSDDDVLTKISCPEKSGKKHTHADKPKEKVKHTKSASSAH